MHNTSPLTANLDVVRAVRRASVGAYFSLLLCLLVSALLFNAAVANASVDNFLKGDGHNLAYTAPAGTTQINTYAPVSGSLGVGATALVRGTSRTGTVNYANGGLVMIIQSTGFTGTATSGDQTAINLSTNQVARWELARISTVSGTTINFTAPLINAYADGFTQVVTVPEYTTLTVALGRTLTAAAWNGTSGGILAALATGTVSINGTLTAAGLGFRGGVVVQHTLQENCTEMDGGAGNAAKGEGIDPTRYGAAFVARGNVANAGGGADCHNAGGAGGGHGGQGGNGSVDYFGRTYNALGGAALTYSMYDHMSFGGGGGAGEENDSVGTSGAAGGGIVFVRGNAMSGAGTITAAGGTAANTTGAANDGAGGGGAGGSIYVRTTGALACTSATVRGGYGGNSISEHGPGGGGAGGKILLQGSSTACTANISNGVAGNNSGNFRSAGPTALNTVGAVGSTTNPGTALAVPVSAVVVPAAAAITNDNTPTISGTSTIGASISIYVDGVLNGTTTADISGNWTYAPSVALSDGAHSTYVYPLNFGLTGAQSNTRSFTVDTGVPSVPTVSAPITATSTNDTTPTFSGTADPSSTVKVYDGATLVCTATATVGGTWTCNAAPAQTVGTHTYTAKSNDTAGNISAASPDVVLTIDTAAPAAPAITAPTTGNKTNDTTPTFSGTAEAGSTVTVYEGVTVICTAIASGGGAWTCDAAATQTSAAHTYTAKATDAANNTSVASTGVVVTVDTTAPTVALSAPVNSSLTNDSTPLITFTVTETNLGTTECSVDSGAWAVCASGSSLATLADGAHTLSVRHTDAAGNVGTANNNFSVDATAPAAPAIMSPLTGSATNDTTPTFSGTAEVGSTVRVYDGVTLICTATATAGGAWACDATAAQTAAAHTYTAKATDAATNVSASSSGVVLTVDVTAPAAPAITSPATGAKTSDTTPTFSGTAEANGTVKVYDGVTLICTATATAGGAWACDATTPQTEAAHTYTAKTTDAASNTSVASTGVVVTVDATNPTILITAPAPSSTTNDSTPLITFSATDTNLGATECKVDSGSWAVCSSGSSLSALSDGSHTLTVRNTDTAGNVGSSAVTFTVDTAAPAAPAITSPTTGSATNDTTPTFSGTAEVGSTVKVYDGVTLVCTATATAGGAWTCDASSAQSVGAHTYTANSTDAAANTSVASSGVIVTVDTTAPAAPAITSPTTGSNTNDSTPTFSGTAEANGTVKVYDGATLVCTATAAGAGAWSCTAAAPQSEGAHTYTAQTTDAAANTGVDSSGVTVTVDLTAPTVVITAPVVNSLTNDNTPPISFSITEANPGTTQCRVDGGAWTTCTSGSSLSALTDGNHTLSVRHTDATGNVGSSSQSFNVDANAPATPTISSPVDGSATSDTTPTFSGTAEAGSSVKVYVDASLVATTTADGSGNWSYDISPARSEGSFSVTVTATDAAANTSSLSSAATVTVDTTAPVVVITAPSTGSLTNSSTPVLTFGVTEVNVGTSECSVNSGAWATCASGGSLATLTDGAHTVTVRHTDAAANVGSSSTTFTVDATAPVVPAITVPSAGTDTNDSTPTFSGSAEAASTVKVYDGATLVCTTTATAGGTWSCDASSSQADGAHTYAARATDAAGNDSADSTGVLVTVDTSAPSAAAITSPVTGAATADTTPTFSGTAEADSTVKVYDGATVVCTATATSGGAWSCDADVAQATGDHTYDAKATDAASNTSVASGSVVVTIDTDAPVAPAITSPTTGDATADTTPTFSGTAEANAAVKVFDGATLICATTASPGGTWTCDASAAQSTGTHTYAAVATDAANNDSATSTGVLVTFDTDAPTVVISAPTASLLTNDDTPLITFTVTEANPGSTECQIDLGSWSSCTSGTSLAALSDGSHTLSVRHTDAAGNVGSSVVAFTVDATAPLAPSVSSPTDGAATNDTTPSFSGTAEADSNVTIYDGATIVCTAVATAGGTWSCDAASAQATGAHSYTAEAADAAGNTSPASSAVAVTVDTTDPATPAVTSPLDGTAASDTTPALNGTAEPSSTVKVYVDGNLVGSATADGSGDWSFTISPALAEGSFAITTTATDAAGNTSAASTAVGVTIDTTTPAVAVTAPTNGSSTSDSTPQISFSATDTNPGATMCSIDGGVLFACASGDALGLLTDGSHTLTVRHTDAAGNFDSASTTFTVDATVPAAPTVTDPTDGTATSDTTPTLSGTAEPGSTVSVYVDGNVVGTATADGAGDWSFTISPALADGSYSLTSTATDAVGNVSPASGGVNLTVDTANPAAPAVTSPVDGASTSDTTPTTSGTAEPGATVKVFVDGNLVGTTPADGLGDWSFTISPALTEGDYVITATATDAAGNTSVASGNVDLNVDTSNPAAPAVSSPADGDSTADTTPTFNGTAEPGSTVSIYVDGNLVGTATADGSGDWNFTVSPALADGSYSVTTTATDDAGNTGPPSSGIDVTVDTTSPAAAVVTSPLDGAATSDTTPVLTGTAEPGSTVKIYIDGNLIGSATVDGSGDWSFTVSPALTEGEYVITATATDAAGNTGAASAAVDLTIDNTAPAVAVTAPANGSVTSVTTPQISFSITEVNLATTQCSVDGGALFTCASGDVLDSLTDGSHTLVVQHTDAAGNVGSASTSFTVDATVPSAPAVTSPTNNASTADTTPTVGGTAEPGSTVSVYVDGNLFGTATADGSGSWSLTVSPALTDGDHAITTTATDVAGNTSAASAPVSVTIDTANPLAPQITSPADGAATSDTTPSVSGTAEPGSTVKIYVNAALVGSTTVDSGGDWSFALAPALTDGSYAITATATDAAANTGPVSTATSLTVDTTAPVVAISSPAVGSATNDTTSSIGFVVTETNLGTTECRVDTDAWYVCASGNDLTALTDGNHTLSVRHTDAANNVGTSSSTFSVDATAPDAPVVTSPSDNTSTSDATPIVGGTAEAGSTVKVYVDGSLVGTTTADGSGNWSFTVAPALTDGTYAITVTATDAVGNTGPASGSVAVTVDTANPSTPAITSPDDGDVTADTTPAVSGTAEAGSTVKIYVDGSQVGTATANGSGDWSLTITPALADGTFAITADATDAAGNTSSASVAVSVTVDTTDPAAPQITSPADGTSTSDTTPSLSGTAEASSTVKIFIDSNLAGTTTADASGDWSHVVTPALQEGDHEITARSVDAAGNTSPASSAVSLTVDTAGPAAPQITGPTDGTDTADTTPTISGTAEAGSTVKVFVDGNQVGTATADGNGDWSFIITPSLADGSYAITAKAADSAGNTGAESASVAVTVDTTNPAAPQITEPTDGSSSNDTTPTVGGTAEAGSTVKIFKDGDLVGTVTADGSGDWSYNVTPALAEGGYTFTATATDDAGNTGPTSTPNNLTIDTIAPAVAISAPATAAFTSDTSPSISFSLLETNPVLTECSVDAGVWLACSPGDELDALDDGAHTLEVRHTDAAGNVGSSSTTFTVDSATPDAPAVTSPDDGDVTANTTPAVSGTAEAGSTVKIYVDAVQVGTATANGSGDWSFTITPALTDGSFAITAKATDAAGNTSAPSVAVSVTVDTTDPAAPQITSPADGTSTSDTSPSLSGTAEAGSTVRVFIDGNPAGTTTADASGDWSHVVTPALPEGDHEITAKSVDAAGNTSPASSAISLTIDTASPAAPQITGPTDGTDTADTTPTISGTAEAGSTVKVFVDGNQVGTATADSSGDWSLTISPALADGSFAITATATDAAGNPSAASTAVSITVDTTDPGAPQITEPADGSSSDDSTPTVGGTAEVGSTVKVFVDGDLVGTVTADGSGDWSYSVTPALAEGVFTLTASASDAAGNTGPTSTPNNLTIDTSSPTVAIIAPSNGSASSNTAPAISFSVVETNPVLTECSVDSGLWVACSPGDELNVLDDGSHTLVVRHTDAAGNIGSSSSTFTVDSTNPDAPQIDAPVHGAPIADNTPTVSGSAEAGSSVKLYVDGTLNGTTTADSSGNWSLTVAPALSDGDHTFTARATDVVGNSGALSAETTVTVDTADPDAPVIVSPNDGASTSDTTPTVDGSAEQGSLVKLYVDGNLTGFTTAAADGSWSFTVSPALATGNYTLTATSTDAAGNVGDASDATHLTVDTTSPDAPVITSPVEGSSTSDTTPTVSGSAEANSSVEVFVDGDAVGTTNADSSGAWSFTVSPAVAAGTIVLTAKASDAAGNASASSNSVTLTVDTTDPDAPVIVSPENGDASNDSTPTITGTAEPRSTVKIYDNGTSIGTVTADAAGEWSYTAASALAEGAHIITARATDAASNISATSNSVELTVDTTDPSAPAITSPDDGSTVSDSTPTISGTAEAGSTVKVYLGGQLTGTTLADGSGDWSLSVSPALADGDHSFTAVATDAAGNDSNDSGSVAVTVDTAAPSAPTITSPDDGTISADTTPTVSGSAEPGASIDVYVDGDQVGSATANGAGSWSLTISPALSEGEFAITAKATDAGGNVSSASATVGLTIDTSAPAAPSISSPADGTSTSNTTPTVSGTAEANSSVKVYLDGDLAGTVTANNAGNWSLDISPALADGEYVFTAKATDAAGNTSAPSDAVDLKIDNVAPAAPAITSPADGTLTNDGTPTMSGSAEADSTVKIYFDGNLAGSTTTNSSGSWSFTDSSAASNGAHVVTAAATDAAGNTGAPSASRSITIDTVKPAITISAPADGSWTNDPTPTATFAVTDLHLGSSQCSLDEDTFVTCTSGADLSALDDGPHTLTVQHTDEAGNTDSATTAFSLDTVAPNAATISSPTNGRALNNAKPTFSGTAEPDSSVTVYVDGTAIGTAAANGSGNWSLVAPAALGDGAHQVRADAADVAGNHGPSSAIVHFAINTTAPTVTVTPRPVASPSDSPVIDVTTGGGAGAISLSCSVDSGAFSPCSAPYTPPALAPGSHTVTIRAIDEAGNITLKSVTFVVGAAATQCPVGEIIEGSPAKVKVLGVRLQGKKLRFDITSDKFVIASLTISAPGKQKALGSSARAVAAGKRSIFVRAPKLPKKNATLNLTLATVTEDGGRSQAKANLIIDQTGKLSMSALGATNVGAEITAEPCGADKNAPKLKLKAGSKVGITGASKININAKANQLSVMTVLVNQNGKLVGRRVFVLLPGKKLVKPLKLLAGNRLKKGPFTVTFRTFAVSGAKVETTRKMKAK